ELDGSGAAENRNRNLEAAVIVVNLLDGAVEVGERTINDTHLLIALEDDLGLRAILRRVHAIDDGVHLGFGERRRGRGRTNETRDTRCVANDVPGVLVEIHFHEDTWHIVRNTPHVTGFVGSATAPPALSEAEVDAIINRVHTPLDRPKPKVVFERNEQVRIVDGPFANFNGTVEEIDNDHSRLKVSVTIFGRSTPVELDFASVEKLG